jgi:hypothetical protein
MSEFEARPLHLHTLDSLLADLISGREIMLGSGERFGLPDRRTRAALAWYRKKGPQSWTNSVTSGAGEELVKAIFKEPPELPAMSARIAGSARRLILRKLEAHRFAGLHKFGTIESPPPNYSHEFTERLTLFEGLNGSGKTSLVNAIIWVLTGELLRPQREPEKASHEFECWINTADEDVLTPRRLSSVTPLPDTTKCRLDQAWVHADTWVELTFADQTGAPLPPVRRSQTRTNQGRLRETPPDLSVLGIDPISARIGTIMPGLLPLIRVGSESELGRAVAELTGLSALIDLANHARRAHAKIEGDYSKAAVKERERVDAAYEIARADLNAIFEQHPEIAPSMGTPAASDDKQIEEKLEEIVAQLGTIRADAFSSARVILGEDFDPAEPICVVELERNIGGAKERARAPQQLPSAARLGKLRALSAEQLNAADEAIERCITEAKTLSDLAKDPSRAARIRLYAHVASWIADHPGEHQDKDNCVVCGGALTNLLDQVTGKPIAEHLQEAVTDAALVSQLLGHWADSALGTLSGVLPEALRSELQSDLPTHPCDLLRAAIVDELFAFDPFKGVLEPLGIANSRTFDQIIDGRPDLSRACKIELPQGCEVLGAALCRLDKAIRFARWCHENDALVLRILTEAIGRLARDGETVQLGSLLATLVELERIVKAAKPISEALTQCDRLKKELKKRRAMERQLGDLAEASEAIRGLLILGTLADQQVDSLRQTLRKEAATWRSAIYAGAYPDTGHELVDARMGRQGELGLIVATGGVMAPAEHVANASALRASLFGFFLAFWEHVFKERGGIATLIFDDPQELLDNENRERLAVAIKRLADTGAQLILTSYDERFATLLVRHANPLEHLKVEPATRLQPRVRTIPSVPAIVARKKIFEDDPNDEEPARNFVDGCRVFLEAELGNLFDDPAHSAWVNGNPDPTLATFVARLRIETKGVRDGLFSAHVFQHFVSHSAVADHSPVLTLMNKSHHGRRQEIRPGDVAPHADALLQLTEMAEEMGQEAFRWRRRDQKRGNVANPPDALDAIALLDRRIPICPDLVAFTRTTAIGESQEGIEWLEPSGLEQKSVFYLRRPNFGFAAPEGTLAIVEVLPGPSADRRLVVARHGTRTYARRLLKGESDGLIALTADILDPRNRAPKTIFLPAAEVALHQVAGVIFDHAISVGLGQDEAVPVDAADILEHLEIAYRVKDQSAVPLALEKQLVLGGRPIELEALGRHMDALVALGLADGSCVLKRIGAALPGHLAHLRQFESVGGLGASVVLSVGRQHDGFGQVEHARRIFGVLYHG